MFDFCFTETSDARVDELETLVVVFQDVFDHFGDHVELSWAAFYHVRVGSRHDEFGGIVCFVQVVEVGQ